MNLNVDKMLELARKVYPHLVVYRCDNQVRLQERTDHDDGAVSHKDIGRFYPSLTGPPEQRLQALDCIVAAFSFEKVAMDMVEHAHDDQWVAGFDNNEIMDHDYTDPGDILEVCISALLGKGQS